MCWKNKKRQAGSRVVLAGLLFLLVTALAGCGAQEQTAPGKTYQLYYLNDKATKIIPVDYVTQTTDPL